MRRLATIALVTFGLAAASVHAAPPSRASVEQLFALMNMDQTIAQSIDKMQAMTRQSITGLPQAHHLGPAQQARFDASLAQVDALLREDMSWTKLEPEFLQIYTETFTQDEIDGQIAFYRTPAGQAVIAKTPQVTARSMAAMQAHMQALLPRIEAAMQQALAPAGAASAAP